MAVDILAFVEQLLTSLIPYASKAAENAAKRFGDDAYEKAKALYQRLRLKIASDETAQRELDRFIEDPGGDAQLLKQVLRALLAEDPELFRELQAWLATNDAPEVRILQDVYKADIVTGIIAKSLGKGARLEVKEKVQEAKRVTGAVIGKIGD